MVRFARVVSVAVLLVTGLPVFTATTLAQPGADPSEIVWEFKEISDNSWPARAGEAVTRSDTGFRREVTVEPTAEFNTSFPGMMIASAPAGFSHSFTVSVEGRIMPGADTNVQGFRVSQAIPLVGGRWDGRSFVGVGVNCVTDIFGAPLGCTPDAGTWVRASETFTVSFPWSVPDDGLFKFGVSALNCPECFVEYVYEAKTVEPEPEPRCRGRAATIGPEARDAEGRIVGTSGADVIVGSPERDIINGRGGKDIICGKGGDDVIRGGSGGDRILGGSGADTIRAGSGKDVVEGGSGGDEIWGGKGDDLLEGNRGMDIIRGDKGDDTARGGAGTDRCAAEREISCERDPEIPGPTVDWTMPDRYGKRSADGIVRPTPNLDPSRFKVDFRLRHGDGSKCSGDDVIKATSPEGTFRALDPGKPCKIRGRFPEGTHRVKFTLTTDEGKGKTTTEVVVQDWLIVGIGDSNGSGEGTPDQPGGKSARWVKKQCHRSANSHQALAARGLERRDKKTSVTFKHLACSGAQIETGLLKRYEGIVPGRKLPPQLDELDAIAAEREVDAVFISVGVNDLNFGELVVFCILWRDCPNTVWETFGSETLRQAMRRWLIALPDRYDQLAARLDTAGIPSDRVYITEYFDSTTDQDGRTCDPLVRLGGSQLGRDFDRREADWAATNVLRPLNQRVRAAAEHHGWNVITGSQQGFIGHGICAGDQSWIVTREQSAANQGDEKGTLHATKEGNRFQRKRLVPVVVDDFWDDLGNPRPPARHGDP